MADLTKQPGQRAPYSQEAEEAVLGSILINPEAMLDLAKWLTPEDFYILRNQYVFEAMAHVTHRGDALDYLTVQRELEVMERLNDVGGPAYLTSLINQTPTSVNALVYGQLVRGAAERRRLLIVGDEIKALALDEEKNIGAVRLEAQRRLDNALRAEREQHLAGHDSIDRHNQIMRDRIERRKRGEYVVYPLPSSWHKLRQFKEYVAPGEFIVVSGPPGSGKSAFLEKLAEVFAQLGVQTDYIHTEMSSSQILDRRMARWSGIAYGRLESGEVTTNDDRRKMAANAEIAKWRDYVIYRHMPDMPFERLQLQMRLAAESGVKVILLDHFQDVQVESAGGKRGDSTGTVRAYEQACIWLNAFAEKRGVTVIVASQENQQGRTKWSGKLIEKAQTWISIKRPALTMDRYYRLRGTEYGAFVGEWSPDAELRIHKARFGKSGKLTMFYHGPGFDWLDNSALDRPSGNVVEFESFVSQSAAEEA